MIEYVEHLANKTKYADYLIIFLHGYGADGLNLAGIGSEWSPALPEVDFLFPNAIEPCPMSDKGYQWFGLYGSTEEEILKGISAAGIALKEFVQKIKKERKLNHKNIALAGFSQGGMMALHTGIYEVEVGAVVCFSGWFMPQERANFSSMANPVLLIHGEEDTVVPITSFERSKVALNQRNIAYEAHKIKGLEHYIDHNAAQIAVNFLKNKWLKSSIA